ncbi:MAG: MerC family mercury resistance protein [Pseudomonadales bacterium]
MIERQSPVTRHSSGWSLAALPGIGIALLPKLTCPVCWPAYTALLSSMGVSFIDYTPFLMPTVAALLAITLWALAHRARARRGYAPFALGLVGAAAVLAGKFTFSSDLGLYLGSGLLVAAALWNVWPTNRFVPLCNPTREGGNHGCETTD